MPTRVGGSITRDLVRRLWSLSEVDLLPEDREALHMLLVDHLAVAAGGAQTGSAEAMRAVLCELVRPSNDGVPVIGTGLLLPPLDAAMANAVAAHSLDFDDTHSGSSSHPGVVVFSTALGAAALARADASAFVTAVIRGYEAMCRIGRAAHPAALYRHHRHPTAVLGHFGAAVTAASLLGLDVERATAALGIVSTTVSGTMQFLEDGDWTKRLNPAVACRNGLLAALLARRGYMGGGDTLGGRTGFLSTASDDAEPELLLDGWGVRPFEIRATSIKPHACCRYNQSPIDAVLALRNAGLVADDVDSILVGLLSVAVDVVWQPVATKRRPANVVDAQFSLPFSVAVALLDGSAGPAQYSEARLADPRLLALMDRVECVTDPTLDTQYPMRWPAWVRIVDRSGRVYEQRIEDPRGGPGNPLTAVEIRRKFDELTCAYPAAQRDAIWEGSRRLSDATEGPGQLFRVLRLGAAA